MSQGNGTEKNRGLRDFQLLFSVHFFCFFVEKYLHVKQSLRISAYWDKMRYFAVIIKTKERCRNLSIKMVCFYESGWQKPILSNKIQQYDMNVCEVSLISMYTEIGSKIVFQYLFLWHHNQNYVTSSIVTSNTYAHETEKIKLKTLKCYTMQSYRHLPTTENDQQNLTLLHIYWKIFTIQFVTLATSLTTLRMS